MALSPGTSLGSYRVLDKLVGGGRELVRRAEAAGEDQPLKGFGTTSRFDREDRLEKLRGA
jgi:hypothetical protein